MFNFITRGIQGIGSALSVAFWPVQQIGSLIGRGMQSMFLGLDRTFQFGSNRTNYNYQQPYQQDSFTTYNNYPSQQYFYQEQQPQFTYYDSPQQEAPTFNYYPSSASSYPHARRSSMREILQQRNARNSWSNIANQPSYRTLPSYDIQPRSRIREDDPWYQHVNKPDTTQTSSDTTSTPTVSTSTQTSPSTPTASSRTTQAASTTAKPVENKPTKPLIEKEYRIYNTEKYLALRAHIKRDFPDLLQYLSQDNASLTFKLKFTSEAQEQDFLDKIKTTRPDLYNSLYKGSDLLSFGDNDLNKRCKEVSEEYGNKPEYAQGTNIRGFTNDPKTAKPFSELHEFMRIYHPEIKQEYVKLDENSGVSVIKEPTGKKLELFKQDLALKNPVLFSTFYPNENNQVDAKGNLRLATYENQEQDIATHIKGLHEEYQKAATKEEKDRYAKEIYLWTTTLGIFTVDRRDTKNNDNIRLAKLLEEANLPPSFITWASKGDRTYNSYIECFNLITEELAKSGGADLIKMRDAVDKDKIVDLKDRNLFIKTTWASLGANASKKPDNGETPMIEGVSYLLDGNVPQQETPKFMVVEPKVAGS